MSTPPEDEQMKGFHGHVRPREDGLKARCGGPALCKTCQAEQELRQLAADFVDELLPPDAMARIFGEKP